MLGPDFFFFLNQLLSKECTAGGKNILMKLSLLIFFPERKIFRPLTHSPSCRNSKSRADPKPGHPSWYGTYHSSNIKQVTSAWSLPYFPQKSPVVLIFLYPISPTQQFFPSSFLLLPIKEQVRIPRQECRLWHWSMPEVSWKLPYSGNLSMT